MVKFSFWLSLTWIITLENKIVRRKMCSLLHLPQDWIGPECEFSETKRKKCAKYDRRREDRFSLLVLILIYLDTFLILHNEVWALLTIQSVSHKLTDVPPTILPSEWDAQIYSRGTEWKLNFTYFRAKHLWNIIAQSSNTTIQFDKSTWI